MGEPGRFGRYGGRYVAPPLVPLLRNLDDTFRLCLADPGFQRELCELLLTFVGRPTPLYRARHLVRRPDVKLYVKREDLAVTGNHYINSAVGQCLIARKMGARTVITDTGSGHNGLATAAAAARLGLGSIIYMAEADHAAHPVSVQGMSALGADVRVVSSSNAVLSEAVGAAQREWMKLGSAGLYVAGAPVGPHPYPTIVRTFQALVGVEVARQLKEYEGKAPDIIVSSLGGGGTALGLFVPFVEAEEVRFVAAETASRAGGSASRLGNGSIGVLHGAKTLVLQDRAGRFRSVGNASAGGFRYPAVAPEIAWLWDKRRMEVVRVNDRDAARCQSRFARDEGILTAIEACYGLAAAQKLASAAPSGAILVASVITSGETQHSTNA